MSQNKLTSIGNVGHADIDGLSIRYAQGGKPGGIPILLTAPWPESILSFYRVLPLLAANHSFIAVDLPGFGGSESRPEVMAPEAMGDFMITLLGYFGLARVHAITPDVGAPAVLFAASKQPDLFESLALGGAAMRADLATGVLHDVIHTPTGALAEIDGIDALKDYMAQAEEFTPREIVDDFRAGSAGRRFEDAVQFVRGYIPDLPKLEPKLSLIKIPVLILTGKDDPIVPPVNGQFLADRLPNNRYRVLDGQHRIWEEAFSDYSEELVSWFGGGYRSL